MKTKQRIAPSSFKLYGVFGFPLKHTFSPAMHQAAFDKLGIPCFYLALELDPKNFRQVMTQKKKLLLEGFNLTVPHKQIVKPYLDSLTFEARAIGAVNTVIRKGKLWIGENTDAYGFLKSLEEVHWKSKGKTVLIFGAGGASRAVIYALCRSGARRIVLLNRTVSKARALAKYFTKFFPKTRFEVRPFEKQVIGKTLREVDIVVNTTSVGLKRADSPLVLNGDFPRAKGNRLAVDLIYNPSETPFLRSAKRAGWKTVNGLGMLLHQGARSFELWTGKKAPVDIMRKALHGCMSRISL